MKKVFALAFALLLAAPTLTTLAQAPAGAEKKSNAVMTADESKFEFGTVKQGDIVEHTFTFRNTGSEPLVVNNVGVSCGCTTPEYTKEPVMPGKQGKITARFNTTGKMGVQNKVLTVQSNNGAGDVFLTLAGTVSSPDEMRAMDNRAAPADAMKPAAGSSTMAASSSATPVAKGKIKAKSANGTKKKAKIEDGKMVEKK